MRSDPAQRHWQKAIRTLRRRVNFAAWLDQAAPAFFFAAVAIGFAAYLLRRTRHDAASELRIVWLAGAVGALVAAAAWGWWRARRRFFGEADARTLLEHRHRLDSALSAAASGIAAWPAPRALPGTLRWHAPAAWAWIVGAMALVAGGAFLPVPAPSAFDSRRGAEKPPALAQTEEWLAQLSEQQLADPEDLEKLAEQARGLGEKSPEERYSHSALEAADTLRSQTAQAISGLGADLEEAADALEPLEQRAGELSEQELGAVAARLGEALRGLREGPLGAREELMKQLAAAANAAGRRGLTPEQAARLREQLAKTGRAATGVVGAQAAGAKVAAGDPDRPVREGTCDGSCGADGNGGSCDGSCGQGRGGVNRGPGHAPLMFSEQASDAGEGRAETASSDDLSRAALGELLAMERGEHELDPAKSVAPGKAGAVAAPAQGGEVVWVDHLTPKERAALKEFFK